MFLTRMVSGLICSKNFNKNASNTNQSAQQHQHQQHQQQSKSPKTNNKKTEKCKRSLAKSDSKKSITDYLKLQVKSQEKDTTPVKEQPSTSKAALKPPTKVKSGSWKRSEKQISNYNTIANKKSKSLRKRSPTWLKFPSTPVKIAENVSYVAPTDSTSVCRPGTTYSEVVFGAGGSSCMVKVKTLTPRRNTNTAQKKLTKALLKCTGNENDASGSEAETDRELFPSLNGINEKLTTSSDYDPINGVTDLTLAAVNPQTASKQEDDEADVVILSEMNGILNAQNGFSDVSYGSYLEQHFQQQQLNGRASNNTIPTTTATTSTGSGVGGGGSTTTPHLEQKPKLFTIDIPRWNFIDADVSADAYPKFLCQFEDEHYLKAEKMALLGLKLALGNNSQQAKFKF